MHILAAREAVESFTLALPLGAAGDRLSRLATATRQLFDQAVNDRAKTPLQLAWADHNLGVLVSEALGAAEPTRARGPLDEAGSVLFLGVRRRLLEALENDPDDLACALALALGTAATLSDRDDARLSEDLGAVTKALTRPGAGPRLAAAATRAVVEAAGRSRRGEGKSDAMQKAATALAQGVREAVERLGKRLPEHPTLALDRIRLVLLSARGSDGTARQEALSMARALLSDHEARFGPSAAQREVTATMVQLRAKDAPAAELARDTLALLEIEAKERRVDARRALKLVKSLAKNNALDQETARAVQKIVDASLGTSDEAALVDLKALLFEAVGDEAALLTLQEKNLEQNPDNHQAARILFERLLRNLRRSLPSPFVATTLEAVVQAVPLSALGKLSADDVDALVQVLRDAFGLDRALAFARQKLTVVRELKQRDFVWKRALALAEESKDEDALFAIARRAIQEKSAPPEARLALARALVAKGTNLDEADDALKGLTSHRGPMAAEAQQLKARIKADPRYREARLNAMLAFEEQIGIGTAKAHKIKVVFTAPTYLLGELSEHPAPGFYEHRHLRVMVKKEELPDGASPTDLRKGDLLEAPIRGQDASHERDKDNLRIYWVADPRLVKLELGGEALATRLAAEDEAYGIGSGQPLPLKVSWDAKKKRLVARLYDAGGKEFRMRPLVDPASLPEGLEPTHVGGRGKRMVGAVEVDANKSYRVVGKLELVAVESGKKKKKSGSRTDKTKAAKTGAPPAAEEPAEAEASPNKDAAPGTGAEASPADTTSEAKDEARDTNNDETPADAPVSPDGGAT